MAEGHGWGGASRADSNHPALTSASAPLLFLVLMSPDCSMCIPLAMTLKLTFARSTSEPEATTTFRF